MVKRAVSATFAEKQTKLASYIKQIAKSVSDERAETDPTKRFTMSSQALVEVELLIEHAMNNIAHNAESILKYSGAGTIGVKTVEVATRLSLSGLLCKDVAAAGNVALDTYQRAVEDATAAA
tara:strand:- start:85 stop:450 length:366 start_codon:yes stop_codon:yes gene_type:complete